MRPQENLAQKSGNSILQRFEVTKVWGGSKNLCNLCNIGSGPKCPRMRPQENLAQKAGNSILQRFGGGPKTFVTFVRSQLSQRATPRAPGRKSPRSPDEKIACNSRASEVSAIVSKELAEDWGWILSTVGR